jgi:hypothetical protein
MLTGVFVGAAVGMWLGPHVLDNDGRDNMVQMARDVADRAERMFRRGKAEMSEAMSK